MQDLPGYTPNWKRLGFECKEECVAHVFSFLKQNEKSILKQTFSGAISIQYQNCMFTLGKEDDAKLGMMKKPLKRAKNE